jgi:hypothetical protein
MKHIQKSDIDAMKKNIAWFVFYAALLAVVVFDMMVWRP